MTFFESAMRHPHSFGQFDRLLGNFIEPVLSWVASVPGLREFESVFVASAENDVMSRIFWGSQQPV